MNTKTLSVKTGKTLVNEDGFSYSERRLEERPVVNFKPIEPALAAELMGFVHAKNINQSITIDGTEYTLDFISHNTNARRQSRSLSVYFSVGRSIIRISDHWSESAYSRSQKLNCGQIDSAWWTALKSEAFSYDGYRAGRYPWKLLAGIAGKTALNKSVPHWKK